MFWPRKVFGNATDSFFNQIATFIQVTAGHPPTWERNEPQIPVPTQYTRMILSEAMLGVTIELDVISSGMTLPIVICEVCSSLPENYLLLSIVTAVPMDESKLSFS